MVHRAAGLNVSLRSAVVQTPALGSCSMSVFANIATNGCPTCPVLQSATSTKASYAILCSCTVSHREWDLDSKRLYGGPGFACLDWCRSVRGPCYKANRPWGLSFARRSSTSADDIGSFLYRYLELGSADTEALRLIQQD